MNTADLMDQLRNGVQLTEAAELAANCIEQLEAALTRTKAATAAVIEVAALEMEDERARAAIRSLVTTNQTDALNRLIAEAVWPYRSVLKNLIGHADEISSPLVEAQPDPRDEVIKGLLEVTQELIDMQDWTGTGSSESGDQEKAAYQQKLAAIAAAKASYHQNQKGK